MIVVGTSSRTPPTGITCIIRMVSVAQQGSSSLLRELDEVLRALWDTMHYAVAAISGCMSDVWTAGIHHTSATHTSVRLLSVLASPAHGAMLEAPPSLAPSGP